jgi:uncharacterized protein
MSGTRRYFDCGSWTGTWPFLRGMACPLQAHEDKLRSLGVVGACLSAVEAVFDQDMEGVNDALFGAASGRFFLPVPVVDPSCASHVRIMAAAGGKRGVPMVRLIPAYHGYAFTERAIGPVCECAARQGWAVSVVMRMEDIRGQYRGLGIEDPDVRVLIKVLSAFPRNAFLVANATPDEADALLASLENTHVDTAYMERPDVLRALVKLHGTERLLFSTHFPFYYPEVSIAKLDYSAIDEDAKTAIACGNAERLLGLPRSA